MPNDEKKAEPRKHPVPFEGEPAPHEPFSLPVGDTVVGEGIPPMTVAQNLDQAIANARLNLTRMLATREKLNGLPGVANMARKDFEDLLYPHGMF